MRSRRKLTLIAALVLLALITLPATSHAQRFGRHGRSVVVVRGFYGTPFYDPFYSPLFFGSPWYPYAWGPPYWYADQYYGPRVRGAALRLEVSPKNTQVWVDGYYAGVVDDFDGVFQRLRLQPGEHELVLYLEGYRTTRQAVKLGPRSDVKVRQTMVKLGAGESSEPPPVPKEPQERAVAPGDEPPQARPYDPRRPERRPPIEVGAPAEARTFGTLAIRVQPGDSEILIDGERWQGAAGPEPLTVHVAEGTHRVEVRKDGYRPFSTEVRVRRGETVPLNVSLPERR